MKTSDFDYQLPQKLIAQTPADRRDESRLMVLDRKTQNIEHRVFHEILDYFNAGDVLVLNDTRVIPAILRGTKVDGSAKIEILLLKEIKNVKKRHMIWQCLVKPGKRLRVGSEASFGNGQLRAKVIEKPEDGSQILEFESALEFRKILAEIGEVSLPPYIKSQLNKSQIPKIKERYQTVYAQQDGASAAPTAGLHFTQKLLNKIKSKGVSIAYVTLHTGAGTFIPVKTEEVEDHKMFSEDYIIPPETVKLVRQAQRVIAVGTTSVRTLESEAAEIKGAKGHELCGSTDLFIYPGFKFRVTDCLITNFHFPRSTLLMLVSAFSKRDFIMRAYKEAITQGYRFFSFGDAMLII